LKKLAQIDRLGRESFDVQSGKVIVFGKVLPDITFLRWLVMLHDSGALGGMHQGGRLVVIS